MLHTKKKGVKAAGIVNAGKPLPMISVHGFAVKENLIEPIFHWR